ncbi:MAG: MBOAT family protein [Magnetococcales bacterium]|nr:MBOAT family protein [Magnetococcales bacterium]
MLFNSFGFIFLFLPLTLTGYYVIYNRLGTRPAFGWLVAASLIFYGYWNPLFVLLLLFSIGFNYGVEQRIIGAISHQLRYRWYVFGILTNLTVLGYFKYANFFLDNLNSLIGSQFHLAGIVLPLGISFFTFQQITLLVDAFVERKKSHYGLLSHSLFICFFPQLIAGPIVHHKEMMPQFDKNPSDQLWFNLAVGVSLFSIGLAKKVLIADTMGLSASNLFDNTSFALHEPHLLEAWGGVLSFGFQVYFDFSGYSDMALGLAFMFGIRLPINFASPFKAGSMIEFWSRWHISLSRLILDYVYTPLALRFMRFSVQLGGGRFKRYLIAITLPSLLTFLLDGFWHGAGWNFILFGFLHGVALIFNQAWRQSRRSIPYWMGWILTFMVVTFAWVPFRTADFSAMGEIYQGLLGLNGMTFPHTLVVWVEPVWPDLGVWMGRHSWADMSGEHLIHLLVFCPLLLLGVLFLPNSNQWLGPYNPGLSSKGYPATVVPRQAVHDWHWRPHPALALGMAALFVWSVLSLNRVTEFIYFQF